MEPRARNLRSFTRGLAAGIDQPHNLSPDPNTTAELDRLDEELYEELNDHQPNQENR